MTATQPAASRRIAATGLRVTRQRIAVLDSIQPGEHLGVEAVRARAQARLGAVSHQAVYDVLAALTGAGLLRRIEPAGTPALYEIRVADNHHHLICRECAAIADIDCATGAAPCLAPEDARGYLLDEAELTWWGLCEQCRPGTPAEPHTTGAQQARPVAGAVIENPHPPQNKELRA
jgi:Fe2+ or Zn2+ uptake regulation protein